MGRINLNQIHKSPVSNKIFFNENQVPGDLFSPNKGMVSFNVLLDNDASTFMGREIFSEDNLKKTIIPGRKLTTLITSPHNNRFLIKNSDNYADFTNSRLWDMYFKTHVSEFNTDFLQNSNVTVPYIINVHPSKSKAIGLGYNWGMIMYLPHTSAGWGAQIFIKMGNEPRIAENEQEGDKTKTSFVIATRHGRDSGKFGPWIYFGGSDELWKSPISDANNVIDHMMPQYISHTSDKSNNLPFAGLDGVVLPLVYHSGRKDFTDREDSTYMTLKHLAQIYIGWHWEHLWIRGYTNDKGWKPWRRIFTNKDRAIFDQSIDIDDPTWAANSRLSLAIGHAGTGLHFFKNTDNINYSGFSMYTMDQHVATVTPTGIQMAGHEKILRSRHIEGDCPGQNGDLHLNWYNNREVIFHAPDGSATTLKQLFTFADEGKRKVVDALISRGITASTTDTWDRIANIIRTM